MHYLAVNIHGLTAHQADIVIALLSQIGYEGFEEQDQQLTAYIPEKDYAAAQLQAILAPFSVGFDTKTIAPTNWNVLWESNFEPVVIGNFCAIRAQFHTPVASVQQEIIITPKMSFGTGHHATTAAMIHLMRGIDFTGRKVLDFGTGTGILAILADKLGASEVTAVDNDEWAINNALENVTVNQAHAVSILQVDQLLQLPAQYDVILANINRQVILENLAWLRSSLLPGGRVLISGILKEDEALILQEASQHALLPVQLLEKDEWLAICLVPARSF